jgi:hypothetical protein
VVASRNRLVNGSEEQEECYLVQRNKLPGVLTRGIRYKFRNKDDLNMYLRRFKSQSTWKRNYHRLDGSVYMRQIRRVGYCQKILSQAKKKREQG